MTRWRSRYLRRSRPRCQELRHRRMMRVTIRKGRRRRRPHCQELRRRRNRRRIVMIRMTSSKRRSRILYLCRHSRAQAPTPRRTRNRPRPRPPCHRKLRCRRPRRKMTRKMTRRMARSSARREFSTRTAAFAALRNVENVADMVVARDQVERSVAVKRGYCPQERFVMMVLRLHAQ